MAEGNQMQQLTSFAKGMGKHKESTMLSQEHIGSECN